MGLHTDFLKLELYPVGKCFYSLTIGVRPILVPRGVALCSWPLAFIR